MINAKKLTTKYSYEVLDEETYIYEIEMGGEDIPFVLSECFVLNAFSLQMLSELTSTIEIEEIEESAFKEIAPTMISAIGHLDTAEILNLEFNRSSISLQKGEIALVAQLQGGRLPEGSTTLPKGFSFRYLLLEVN